VNDNRLEVTTRVEASPAAVFRIVTDPRMHVELDGSDMLQSSPTTTFLAHEGDTFDVEMDREPLGDLPMGKYRVRNTVTRIVPDTLVEWNVGTPEHGAFGHVYGWAIATASDGRTEVTNYCDWSALAPEVRERFPIVPRSMMEQSVANLTKVLGDPATSSSDRTSP
jgi:hypothetical protein